MVANHARILAKAQKKLMAAAPDPQDEPSAVDMEVHRHKKKEKKSGQKPAEVADQSPLTESTHKPKVKHSVAEDPLADADDNPLAPKSSRKVKKSSPRDPLADDTEICDNPLA